MIRYILFDLSEVFINGLKGIEPEIARLTSKRPEDIIDHLMGDKLNTLFEGKISEEEYWGQVIDEGEYEITPELFKSIARKYFDIEIPGTKEILARLKPKGYVIGLLSDHTREWIEYVEEKHSFMGLFDVRCYSFQAGHTKLASQSFEYALGRMGADPSQTLFIDDQAKNLVVAQSAGIKYVHHFTDSESLEKALIEMNIRL